MPIKESEVGRKRLEGSREVPEEGCEGSDGSRAETEV